MNAFLKRCLGIQWADPEPTSEPPPPPAPIKRYKLRTERDMLAASLAPVLTQAICNMTLRELSDVLRVSDCNSMEQAIAKRAYAIADAVIAEGEKS
jgi:hypothetical protein